MSISKNIIIILLYFMLVALHLVASWNQTAAHVIPDEVSYLAQARYFSGKDTKPDTTKFLKQESSFSDRDVLPDTKNWHYYHFGYPILVSPIYWLTDSPSTAYKGVMVFNSFLLSSLFLIIFAWIKELKRIDFYTTVSISFIVSIYPAYIIQSHIGWAENALIPSFALCCLLLTYYLKSHSIKSILLFAFAAGLQYTIHPRGLASTLAAILFLIGLTLVDKDRWPHTVLGLCIIIGIIISTKSIADEIASLMNTHTQNKTVITNLFSLLEFEFFTAIIGNLLYLTLSTIGLFLVGAYDAIRQISSQAKKSIKNLLTNEYTGSLLYILIASSLTFGLSIVFLGRNEAWHETSKSLDFFLYGRYNETFLSIFITLGLLWLCSSEKIQQMRSSIFKAFWLLATVCLIYFIYLLDYQYLRSIHSPGIFPWYFLSTSFESRYSNAIIFFAPLLWTWLAMQLFFENTRKGLIMAAIYFLLLDISLIIYLNPKLQVIAG
ncbi:MAG: hypothetical protein JAZ12_13550 [Candidatus Thiodiazotropha taylori]|nr:hypothetical protein [Candidatus Thiodiazotropha taylori]